MKQSIPGLINWFFNELTGVYMLGCRQESSPEGYVVHNAILYDGITNPGKPYFNPDYTPANLAASQAVGKGIELSRTTRKLLGPDFTRQVGENKTGIAMTRSLREKRKSINQRALRLIEANPKAATASKQPAGLTETEGKMRIGILQLNFKVGDFESNRQKIIQGYHHAVEKGVSLVVTSELALFGYPPGDLLLRNDYLLQQNRHLNSLSHHIGEVGLILGATSRTPGDAGMPLHNSAALIRNKKIDDIQHKSLLPNSDVFDEKRYFEAAAV